MRKAALPSHPSRGAVATAPAAFADRDEALGRDKSPLVTIGIPTYNRAELLARSIESALGQYHQRIEIIISNNASTDGTRRICREYAKRDRRIIYLEQLENVGATANFQAVLEKASGDYFMWLGDDDWLDPSYLAQCLDTLQSDPRVSLVSGAPIYYRDGVKAQVGKLFNLTDPSTAHRVIKYYTTVRDNGMFYGLMRTHEAHQLKFDSRMGGDWHLVANLAAYGKCVMNSEFSVHRELGGATASYSQIANALQLPAIQAKFPMTTIAFGAFENVMSSGAAFKCLSTPRRLMLAIVVFVVVISRPTVRLIKRGGGGITKSSIRYLARIRFARSN